MTGIAESPPDADRRVLVLNPEAGDANHAETVRALAAERGYEVRETDSGPDVVETAARAARDAGLVAAAGGDGTLTRAVRGFDEADAFDDTMLGVVPAGTGNNFASNVGVTGLEHGFEVIEEGVRRRIDVGLVDETPFLNSCVAGLTAEASAETDAAEKERWGTIAYAITTARTLQEFDSLRVTVDPDDGDSWSCDAKLVFVGNARALPRAGRSQANVEDGLLEVAVVEEASPLSLLEESVQAAFGADATHLRRFETSRLSVTFPGTPNRISVDGEIRTASSLTFGVRPQLLWLPVGEAYDPDPEPGGG